MATLKDIANITGLNISTVSRALNDSSEIAENTKKLVRKVAADLQYFPDYTAKALAGKGTKSIGVIVPEISSSYYASMLNKIEDGLNDMGYSLIVGMAHHNMHDEMKYLNIFSVRRVDGIILAGSMHKEIIPKLDEIKKNNNIPIVLIHAFIPYEGYDYITVDDNMGIDAALKFLKSQGHRRLGYIADELASRFRIEKIRESVGENGMILEDRHIKIGKDQMEYGGYIQMNKLLMEKYLPTAVLASYDHFAIGAIKALHDQEISVPKDISIIGYDNIRESAFLPCPLTTISPPIEEMVQKSIEILHEKIYKKTNTKIHHISLAPQLIIRDSTQSIIPVDY